MSRAWAGGSTRRWRAFRRFILERDRYLCQVRDDEGRLCGAPATDAAHKVSLAEGGDKFDPANCHANCEHHNSSDGGQIAHRLRAVPREWTW